MTERNNFPQGNQNQTVTREQVERLQNERPDHVQELDYTIGGTVEAYVHSNLNAEREAAITYGERRLNIASEEMNMNAAFAANEGRAKAAFNQTHDDPQREYIRGQQQIAEKTHNREPDRER